ncbi:C4-dicarboxylate transporter [Caldanaerobius fijiensis DSM 17918]|uniref:C4-dicarboxylate transporter n=1 Tax=Caldanaerobius fijiensis DSM 17918 TaxID=1121256 RepID=A0A1M4X0W3_9THEO|nr:hypothetical protein [Caldanaerobius fijiensis]SHE87129.1 C4-dicarboxylate transporter [Caldanaerobius fijiensis DSM 17918]
MIPLTPSHYIFILTIIAILIAMLFRKDILIPCLIGIFLIGLAATGNVVKAVQTIYRSLIISGEQLWSIILIIALVISMAEAIRDIGADYIMIKPILKYFKKPLVSYLLLGLFTMVVSLFLWASPALGLLSAMVVPVALKTGLSRMSTAMAINIFGFGIAMSGDFFIQGAPSITATSAGLPVTTFIKNSFLLWLTMSTVTALSSFVYIWILWKKGKTHEAHDESLDENDARIGKGSRFIAIFTPIAFFIDIALMVLLNLKGQASELLIGGTTVIIMILALIIRYEWQAFSKITDYIKEGFTSSIKIFAPVIVITGFFLLGNQDTSREILGKNAHGFLMDLSKNLSYIIPLNKYTAALIQIIIGAFTGLSGSGFAGLPLVGALARTFHDISHANISILAFIGQLSSIWVGTGTLVPWSVIPVSGLLKVDPFELVKNNLIPVLIGFIATFLVALLLV